MYGDQLEEFVGLKGLGEEVITLVCPTLVKSCEAWGHSVFRISDLSLATKTQPIRAGLRRRRTFINLYRSG